MTSASRWHSDVSGPHARERRREAGRGGASGGDAWPHGRAPRGVASHFAERLAGRRDQMATGKRSRVGWRAVTGRNGGVDPGGLSKLTSQPFLMLLLNRR